jgi:hypothetical protein
VKRALAFLLLGVSAQVDAASCGSEAVTLDQAKALVLASPNIRAAVRLRGAKPVFEWVDETPLGWRFDINSNTPCEGDIKVCSNLLGHYSVVRGTGTVYDLNDGDGDGALVSSVEMRRLHAGFRRKFCAGQRF